MIRLAIANARTPSVRRPIRSAPNASTAMSVARTTEALPPTNQA